MQSRAEKAAQSRYDKENTQMVLLKLNKKTDADILLKLQEAQNKQGYIKELIRQDIKGESAILSHDSLRFLVQPVGKRFSLDRIFLFGSYARNEATEDSDVDLLVEGGNVRTLYEFMELQKAFEKAVGKKVDVVESSVLNKETRAAKRFRDHIERDKVMLYENTDRT